jgi:uncharacterized membrane protein YcaP (DUF421 family)
MDAHDLALTALRSVGVYILMLVVIRVLGKRTVGNFTAFDLLVALMLGEVVDEIIFGDVPLAQGAVAVLVVSGLHYANSWLSFRNAALARLTEGEPTPLVQDGKLHAPGMAKERMSRDEVLAALRLQGLRGIEDVKLAQVERDGMVSVIKQGWAEALQKKDLLAAIHARERAVAEQQEEEDPVATGPGRE